MKRFKTCFDYLNTAQQGEYEGKGQDRREKTRGNKSVKSGLISGGNSPCQATVTSYIFHKMLTSFSGSSGALNCLKFRSLAKKKTELGAFFFRSVFFFRFEISLISQVFTSKGSFSTPPIPPDPPHRCYNVQLKAVSSSF